ncbi:MAG TPA: hypothetical protein VN025_10165 [Candidatus Dormibacteraeota bacterium]|jgi:hypothetical protein|nr:hypothetical protein [Candidatus Dormibacteraeota bacterium]
MSRKKLAAGISAIVVLAVGIYFAYAYWASSQGNSRESLLRSLPADATAVIYVDIAELRQGAILKSISSWSASATIDPEYKQFVKETGFDYEKDLDRVGVATKSQGTERTYFALMEGRFDRKKIEAYLRKNGVANKKGTREVFLLTQANSDPSISMAQRWILIAFLSDRRIAITNAADLNSEIESASRAAGHQEWVERFDRLAGTPAFALIRQDAAIGALLSERAPGGMRSPQLAQLLNQLLWISIAGKPEGNEFRAVLEGECPNEASMRQLSDFLNGISLMAQAGLNDPKLRQQMDPAEREAYLQLLNSVDVMRLDRGTSKSVRMAFVVTPEAWEILAKAAPIVAPHNDKNTQEPSVKSSPKKKKSANQQQTTH